MGVAWIEDVSLMAQPLYRCLQPVDWEGPGVRQPGEEERQGRHHAEADGANLEDDEHPHLCSDHCPGRPVSQ